MNDNPLLEQQKRDEQKKREQRDLYNMTVMRTQGDEIALLHRRLADAKADLAVQMAEINEALRLRLQELGAARAEIAKLKEQLAEQAVAEKVAADIINTNLDLATISDSFPREGE